jgi:phage host-nuclease inhibitor protein Gam
MTTTTDPADILAYLDGDEPADAPRPAWDIRDEDDAAWALDRVLRAQASLARIKAACEARIKAAEREVERAESYFVPLLRCWADANRPEFKGKPAKTIRLTTGALAYRATGGKPVVTDREAAKRWAHRHLPEAIKVRVVVDVALDALKEFAATTGELPDGVELAPADETFALREL